MDDGDTSGGWARYIERITEGELQLTHLVLLEKPFEWRAIFSYRGEPQPVEFGSLSDFAVWATAHGYEVIT